MSSKEPLSDLVGIVFLQPGGLPPHPSGPGVGTVTLGLVAALCKLLRSADFTAQSLVLSIIMPLMFAYSYQLSPHFENAEQGFTRKARKVPGLPFTSKIINNVGQNFGKLLTFQRTYGDHGHE